MDKARESQPDKDVEQAAGRVVMTACRRGRAKIRPDFPSENSTLGSPGRLNGLRIDFRDRPK